MANRRFRIAVYTGLVLTTIFFIYMGMREARAAQIKADYKSVQQTDERTVLACGLPVGIYMETEGILVLRTQEIATITGDLSNPSEHVLREGDYLLSADGKEISDKDALIEFLEENQEETVEFAVLRKESVIEVAVTPVLSADGSYKIGLWVRDNTQGIGTLTFFEKNGSFAALGHGISDLDTGNILHLGDGKLYRADILSIQKGEPGDPGELSGIIHYQDENLLGTISDNALQGIHGTLQNGVAQTLPTREVHLGSRAVIDDGPAAILCSLGGQVCEYGIEISNIDWEASENNKCFEITVTDPKLLEQTSGIIQGMSGCPILQDGYLVGAVTHVFVNDPTKGYGIFIEMMTQ